MRTPALARATLRGTTWISRDGLRELLRRERLWIIAPAAAGFAVAVGGLLFMLVGTYRSLLVAGAASGHPELLFFYALLGDWVFLFVTAIPLALSVLYYSRDLSMLFSLPIRPLQIVGAKTFLLYLYCLPVNLLLLVPALWIYISAVGATASVAASAIVHLLLSPFFPLALAILVVLALMRVVNLSRFRIALEVAGMTLGIAGVIGLQVAISRATFQSLQGGGFPGQRSFSELFASLASALPPVAWAANGFATSGGAVPLLLSLILTMATLGAALLLAPLSITRDAMERREGRREKGAGGIDTLQGAGRKSAPHGVTRSLVRREWSILTSSSTFIFEAVAEILILPLLLGVYSLILPKHILGQAVRFITGTPVASLFLMAVLVMMTSLTTVSSTSVSREGRLLALSLTMPVPGRRQVRAKLLLHVLFFSSAYVMDLGICFFLFRFPPASLAFLLPGGFALQVVGFSVSIFFDLKKPFLKWTHPQQAMKSNINAGAGIGGTAAVVVVLAVPCSLLVLSGVDPFLVGCGAAAAGILLAAILLPRVLAYADGRYGGGLELE